MIIQKTFSYRLEPSKVQLNLFIRHAGCVRLIYNWGLSKIKEALDNKEKIPSVFDLHKQLTALKQDPEFSFLKEVHSQVLQQVLHNLGSALKNLFRQVKNKEKVGKLRFKKKGFKEAFRFPQGIKAKEEKVFIPKIGNVKYRDSRPLEGEIKHATIKRDGKHWYIQIFCEIEVDKEKVPVSEKNTVGIDIGIKNFAYLSNGQIIENLKILYKYSMKLAHLQRQFSRKKKGSNNQKKCAIKIANLYRLIGNIRRDFQHKLSTNIAKNHSVVVVENLNIQGMVQNRCLSRAISDAGWRQFIDFLEYKCRWLGKHFVKVGRFLPTTKQCSSCGNLQNISLQTRTYICNACSLVLDRDLNASINIRAAGLAALKACGEISVG